MRVDINEKNHEVEFTGSAIMLNGKEVSFQYRRLSENRYLIIYNHRSYEVIVQKTDNNGEYDLYLNGSKVKAEVKSDLQLMLDKMGLSDTTELAAGPLKAPMPGLILEILVVPGSEVRKGDPLLILEAMKMENVIKAANDCVIDSINVSKSESVEKNQPLITFK